MLQAQLTEIWNKIHTESAKQVHPYLRMKAENLRLIHLNIAARNAPKATLLGRRRAKGRGKGYGMINKHSRVIPQVHIETVFKARK